jgi:transglutaminase-like putative cysteine protease
VRYRVRHTTHYNYADAVTLCHNLGHLLPRDTPFQRCVETELEVTPTPGRQAERFDYYGNRVCHFAIENPHRALTITAESLIDVNPRHPGFDPAMSPSCASCLDALHASQDPDTLLAREFTLNSRLVKSSDELAAYAQPMFAAERPVLEAALDLTQSIFREFKYDPKSTHIYTPLEQVLSQRSGVCQDFAHLAIGCLRSMGFSARYVSGYLETLPPPGQEKLVGADASHAWFEIFVPEIGWFEFDPTNDCVAGEQHIVTAWGRDFFDVSPLQGVFFGGGDSHTLKVSVDVNRDLLS